jgi:CRP-like cAMP-binding protein
VSTVATVNHDLGKAFPPEGRNAILDALEPEALNWIQGRSSEVELEAQQPVSAEEEGVDGLYFPLSGLMCRLVSLPEGSTVKVSIVGREGMTGTSALFDTSVSAHRVVAQLPGKAVFLPRAHAAQMLAVPGVDSIMLRYVLLLVREASLTAACNRAHPAKQRLARWLLLIADRAGLTEFPLTHESLSSMLGVRRESISVAAHDLRSTGAIEYRRGRVAITDRAELVSHSCSCYAAVTEAYDKFLTSELRSEQGSAAPPRRGPRPVAAGKAESPRLRLRG